MQLPLVEEHGEGRGCEKVGEGGRRRAKLGDGTCPSWKSTGMHPSSSASTIPLREIESPPGCRQEVRGQVGGVDHEQLTQLVGRAGAQAMELR